MLKWDTVLTSATFPSHFDIHHSTFVILRFLLSPVVSTSPLHRRPARKVIPEKNAVFSWRSTYTENQPADGAWHQGEFGSPLSG